ncbi:hemerythrin domain-containing protein [Rhodococcus sp. NPDC059968]|uniref:hemerythrin domain-containing protein n=1 Tax=Rhodococcus sp. NPDC059968 TaxID=3347017 RepID=UPI00366C8B5D
MITQLRQAHAPLRDDIVTLDRALTILLDATADHSAVPKMINSLTAANFVWQLRVNCDFYCNHLTLHHTIEDQRMFPTMARRFPELKPVIGELKAQHEAIGELVDEAKAASLHLTADHESVARARTAIGTLATHLRAHLADEETAMFPYFRTMTQDWHLG